MAPNSTNGHITYLQTEKKAEGKDKWVNLRGNEEETVRRKKENKIEDTEWVTSTRARKGGGYLRPEIKGERERDCYAGPCRVCVRVCEFIGRRKNKNIMKVARLILIFDS